MKDTESTQSGSSKSPVDLRDVDPKTLSTQNGCLCTKRTHRADSGVQKKGPQSRGT